ncbi:MAG: hypothetical protein KH281_10185 [Lachnospiraceae bacterium]|nr:hypothetical protein [Lachnospiraceae bacterium]
MFEEDYIIRQIREMVRMLLKLLFQLDQEEDSEELLRGTKENEVLRELLEMVDDGRINEAENRVYELCEDGEMANLKVMLLFYDYLNGKSDEYLEQCEFSREELKEDMRDLLAGFGLSDMAEAFLRKA